MITLLFLSPAARAGKTGVVSALALRLAYQGRRVLALRLGDAGDAAATADARVMATLPFARGRGGAPVSVNGIAGVIEAGGRPVEVLLLEAEAGAGTQDAAETLDARVVLVGRGSDTGEALQRAAAALGPRLSGVVVTGVPERKLAGTRESLIGAGLPVLAVVPEDRTLYAPSVGAIIEALDAEVILGDPDDGQVIEHLLVNPVTVDPGQPYYARRRGKAVITRADKTDLQLAALQTQTDLLILTGGTPPSPYTIDRAAGEEVPLLLTRGNTRETVARLEDIFTRSRFSGEQKLERMGALLEQYGDSQAIAGLTS